MYFWSTSKTVTSNPDVADTCAIPEPIKPQPRTPTFFISITRPSFPAEFSPGKRRYHSAYCKQALTIRSRTHFAQLMSWLKPRPTMILQFSHRLCNLPLQRWATADTLPRLKPPIHKTHFRDGL